MRVLVTGGYGFIGSNVVRALLREHHRVVVLDDLSTGRRENLEEHHNLVPVFGTVCDTLLLHGLVAECDAVVHCAVRNIMLSSTRPYEDLQVNLVGTFNVLRAAEDSGARVVYLSSSSIYGNQEGMPTREDARPNLTIPYSASKYGGEVYCNLWSARLPVVILRLTNTYGVNQRVVDGHYCGVVGRFMHAALTGQPLVVYGDGRQTRDFIYVEDVVRAVERAIADGRMDGGTFNVGTGTEISILRLANRVGAITGQEVELDFRGWKRVFDTIDRRCLDSSRLQALGWRPEVDLTSGLIKTREWMLREGLDHTARSDSGLRPDRAEHG